MTVNAREAIRGAFDGYADERLAAAPAASGGPAQASRPARTKPGQRRSRRRQLAVACVVMLLLATAAAVTIQLPRHGTPAGEASTPLQLDGFTFDPPTSLARYNAEGNDYGPSTVAAYLTDQATVSQCTTSTTSQALKVSCHAPVVTLAPDKTLVVFEITSYALAPNSEPSFWDTTIAGVPAHIDHDAVTASCPAGTATQTTATIRVSPGRPGSGLIVTGCFGPDATTQAAFDTMLSTARYAGPTER